MRTQSWYGRGAVYLDGQKVADIRYHMTILNCGGATDDLHGTIEVADPTPLQAAGATAELVLKLTAHQKQLSFTLAETERPNVYTVIARELLRDL